MSTTMQEIDALFTEIGAGSLWRKRKGEALLWLKIRNPEWTPAQCRNALLCWLGKIYCNVEQPYRLWRLSTVPADVAAMLPLLRVCGDQHMPLIRAANYEPYECLLEQDKELDWQWRVATGREAV